MKRQKWYPMKYVYVLNYVSNNFWMDIPKCEQFIYLQTAK